MLYFIFLPMKKLLASIALKLWGWKVVVQDDVNNLDRCILIVAPHTHNSEYILGNLAYWKLGKNLKVIIKDQHTKAFYGGIIKAIGGIGIDRSQKNDLVNFVAKLFEKENFSLVITPEGTRSRVEKWRKGFYHMALAAKVPIVFASGDFKSKTMYLGHIIPYDKIVSMTYEELLKEIETYYIENDINPKIPENWNPNIS